jgi:hypothetical protein
VAGTPNLVTQTAMKASAHTAASMVRSGAASSHGQYVSGL